MERKDRIDAFGALSLTGFSLILAFNQVVIAVVNEGLQPVFFAGLRSLGALACLAFWFGLRNRPIGLRAADVLPGLTIGGLFAAEFVFLFIALDLTTVTRVSVIFYTMPLWLAVMAHFAIPGEMITRRKAFGLVAAFSGVVIAILWRNDASGAVQGSLLGDFFALLAAIAWAGIALVARTSLSHIASDRQLVWQLGVSAIILLCLAPFFGPLIRDFIPMHLAGLAFQIIVVATFGYAFWLWLLTIYPAPSVAAFSFLTPGFGVALGWALLGEAIGPPILVALGLVCLGLVLMNRPGHVPQKV
jgi:drug/metabolite transporter (DMT)-like permease